jgi:alpha-tubulin suppressor-like RCC1 family protein
MRGESPTFLAVNTVASRGRPWMEHFQPNENGTRSLLGTGAEPLHGCSTATSHCWISARRQVLCVGDNFRVGGRLSGRLTGTVGRFSQIDPDQPEGMGPALALLCAEDYTCGLRAGGALWCWGYRDHLRFSVDASRHLRPAPVQTPGPVAFMKTAVARERLIFALTDGSTGYFEQQNWMPVLPAGTYPVDLAGSCGLLADGRVTCAGSDARGGRGDGAGMTATDAPPTLVVGFDDAIAIAGGFGSVCAVRADGSAWCWGSDNGGNLGNTVVPANGFSEVPLRVDVIAP